MNLEINISCPNVINNLIHDDLNKFLNPQRKWCAIKLSPTTDFKLITKYLRKHIYTYPKYIDDQDLKKSLPISPLSLQNKIILI